MSLSPTPPESQLVSTDAAIVNSDDDIRLHTVEDAPPMQGGTYTGNGFLPVEGGAFSLPSGALPSGSSSPWPHPLPRGAMVTTDGCPCNLDFNCEQDCCVEALRAVHR